MHRTNIEHFGAHQEWNKMEQYAHSGYQANTQELDAPIMNPATTAFAGAATGGLVGSALPSTTYA
jgi:hypothetical protein